MAYCNTGNWLVVGTLLYCLLVLLKFSAQHVDCSKLVFRMSLISHDNILLNSVIKNQEQQIFESIYY